VQVGGDPLRAFGQQQVDGGDRPVVAAIADAVGDVPDSVWVTFRTVTVMPRIVVLKGTFRLSSIITAKPASCSSSPSASTVGTAVRDPSFCQKQP
jgi:hypothetical protein